MIAKLQRATAKACAQALKRDQHGGEIWHGDSSFAGSIKI
jgi:hypothetical protein